MIKNAIRHPGVMNPQEYHKPQLVKRGDPKFVMSSTEIRKFAQCPDKYINGAKFEGSKSTEFGSLVDTRLLTPELFDSIYVVSPEFYPANARSTEVVEGRACVGDDLPWNGTATYCKNWKKEQSEGLEVVSTADVREADFAIGRILSKPVMKQFLEDSDRQVYFTAEWFDEETGLVIPIKILVDLLPRLGTAFASNIGDFKTTRNAALLPFQMDAFKMKYHVQLALYRDIVVAAERGGCEDVNLAPEDSYNVRRGVWLMCENIHPYQPGRRIMDSNFYDIGRMQYRTMLKNYCQCVKYSIWPDYEKTDEAVGEWGVCAAMPFMLERAMFEPKYDFTPVPEIDSDKDLKSHDTVP